MSDIFQLDRIGCKSTSTSTSHCHRSGCVAGFSLLFILVLSFSAARVLSNRTIMSWSPTPFTLFIPSCDYSLVSVDHSSCCVDFSCSELSFMCCCFCVFTCLLPCAQVPRMRSTLRSSLIYEYQFIDEWMENGGLNYEYQLATESSICLKPDTYRFQGDKNPT